jgi:LPS export ABC transporter protein LptC
MFGKAKQPLTLKRFLLAAIAITIGAIVVVFVGYRRILDQNEAHLAPLAGKADIVVGSFEQTATKDGIKEWQLKAKSAQYTKAQGEAVLKDLAVTFFLKDGRKVHLTADQGMISTESSDLKVSGNVIADNGDYRLKAEQMHYLHSKRVLLSQAPVQILGPRFTIVADSILFDLNTKQTLLKGNVEGNFSEKLAL